MLHPAAARPQLPSFLSETSPHRCGELVCQATLSAILRIRLVVKASPYDGGRPISDYDEAIARAGRWLKSQQTENGSSGENLPLWAYYTQPMAFRAMGEPGYAARTLSYIRNEFLKEDGLLHHNRGGVEGVVYAPLDDGQRPYVGQVRHLFSGERMDTSVPGSEDRGLFYHT
jgi:hypothetical protein